MIEALYPLNIAYTKGGPYFPIAYALHSESKSTKFFDPLRNFVPKDISPQQFVDPQKCWERELKVLVYNIFTQAFN